MVAIIRLRATSLERLFPDVLRQGPSSFPSRMRSSVPIPLAWTNTLQ
jgi:hypothetical protein